MRKKLITLLKSNMNILQAAGTSATATLRLADNLIENGVTVQEWIPVTERLPKHGEIVLCFLIFEEVRVLQWDNVSKWWLGYGSGDDWQKKHITHWMPLPEPPKEVE